MLDIIVSWQGHMHVVWIESHIFLCYSVQDQSMQKMRSCTIKRLEGDLLKITSL